MAIHKVIQKTGVGQIIKDGKSLSLTVATVTSDWKRPSDAAKEVGKAAFAHIANWKEQLPADTQEICVRENEHTSDIDKRDHITVGTIDSKGQWTTRHVPVKK